MAISSNIALVDLEYAYLVRHSLSCLLRTERIAKGRSVRTLARRLKIKRRLIKKWESGLQCPPGPVMIAIFEHLGPSAFRKLEKLDLELQFERYRRRSISSPKNPAIIWAEKHTYRRAA